jgi:hypothetical protein
MLRLQNTAQSGEGASPGFSSRKKGAGLIGVGLFSTIRRFYQYSLFS